jgi:hypothetical protein
MRPVVRALWRWLLLAHRWIGIASCLLFAVWFASGAVMMYVRFPELTTAERARGLEPLRLDRVKTTPAQVLREDPRELRLVMTLGRPAWQWRGWDNRCGTAYADDGQPLHAVDASQALQAARTWAQGHALAARPRHLGLIDHDQWTVPQGLDPWRPLHRVALRDAARTELYVSARTGEVVRDTTRHERLWNWLGAVPHWIYFTPIRHRPPLWHVVVVWVAGVAMVSAASGLVLGWARLRIRRPYKTGRSPYRGVAAWHHWLGLGAGLLLSTWILSGWLSMNPNGWFDTPGLTRAGLQGWRGSTLSSATLPETIAPPGAVVKEVQWRAVGGRHVISWLDDEGRSRATTLLPAPVLQAAARRLLPGAAPAGQDLLAEDDRYYYSHHAQRPLPVLRLRYADAAQTWVHVDPASGEIVNVTDATDRANRWWFNALHSLDFPWLIRFRPAWDLVVLGSLAAGLALSITAIVAGWRRLRREARRLRPRPRGAPARAHAA